jgi:hypothetical protein
MRFELDKLTISSTSYPDAVFDKRAPHGKVVKRTVGYWCVTPLHNAGHSSTLSHSHCMGQSISQTATPSTPTSCPVPRQAPARCPVPHQPQAPAQCPVQHDAPLNPLNQMPALPQTPSLNQSVHLPTSRTVSSIPRDQSAKWEYPSPQQFYNALVRKGWETPEVHVETMVDIHNFLNEQAWLEVLKWERRQNMSVGPVLCVPSAYNRPFVQG